MRSSNSVSQSRFARIRYSGSVALLPRFSFLLLRVNDVPISVLLLERIIQKKRRDYSDPTSAANTKKLNDDLQSIQTIMRKTIDDVLDRGNKLDDVTEMSKSLASESKRYKWGAKKLSTMVSQITDRMTRFNPFHFC
jgi:uncharacterized phage infection (PIP) family protein YhgE